MNLPKYTKEIIIEKVKETGATDERAQQVYERGSAIATSRAYKKSIEKLDEYDRSQLEGKPPEFVRKFFAQNPGKLFFLTDEEIQAVEDATWEEYFSLPTS